MTAPVLGAPLVSTQWLADYLGNDKLVVLDATVYPITGPNGRPAFVGGHEQYLVEGHIPGALFADLVEEFSDTESKLPFTHSTAEAFAAAVGALGIDNETTVVVYDASIGQWASRLWWLFRTFGYDRVAVLDGGFKKWRAEDRATDVGHREPTPATFTATAHPELWATASDIEDIVAGTAEGALVCALPPKEFSGEEGSRARKGHIPGSVSVPSGRLIDRDNNTVIPESELRTAFGATLNDDRIVLYCAAGIAATSDALALTLLGHRNISVYDGSLAEWTSNEDRPVASLV